jgi:hypothetical protein
MHGLGSCKRDALLLNGWPINRLTANESAILGAADIARTGSLDLAQEDVGLELAWLLR